MASILKRGRKNNGEMSAPMPDAPPAGMATAQAAVVDSPPPPPLQPGPARNTAADYTPPTGADDFQLAPRHMPAEPPPSRDPSPRPGGLLSRVLGDPGEQTAAERDRVAALEFEQAIAPVMEYMRAAVPEATTPQEAERILGANQGEITPDPKGGAYVAGDAFERDARVYYRLLRRNYEKNPRPSEKRGLSPHLHGSHGKLTGTKGW